MRDIKIAAVQYDIAWKNKAMNMNYLQDFLNSIRNGGYHLIVLPEMFATGFCFDLSLAEEFDSSPTIAWMRQWSQRTGAHLVGSLMVCEKGQYYNRLVWVDEKGGVQSYDKRHLFGMSAEPEHFTPGQEKLVVQLNDWKICPMICYDLRFPVWIRNKEGYDLLIFIANWPERRSNHWEWLLKARAVENQCYVVGINRVGSDGEGVYHDGRSAVIDPWGNTLLQASHSPHVLVQTIDKDTVVKAREQMPFLRDMDGFEIRP